ncbi:hypothetical protein AB1L42_06210 [Thalassoglobus sp. JC818]|uniref:hypothetical protein n=1 Tax=Thalassoglobus sp. JC818 TaxID=3232136 RepID=UPI00345A044D
MFSMTFKTTAILLAAAAFNSALAQDVQSGGPAPGQTYPQLNAPLYPSPVQHTPYWNGGTIVTNQALAPHEMLYPHTYRAVYPPYYYKVKGGWIWTPFGMRQHEEVKLQGTEVTVKYRSHFPLFSGFKVPRNDLSLINCGPRW